jgi:iron complex transport system ATP-binding protein
MMISSVFSSVFSPTSVPLVPISIPDNNAAINSSIEADVHTVLLSCDRLAFQVGGTTDQALTRIVHDVTNTWKAGEFFGICGPNGAGKTTLLRLLGGLLKPASGSVYLKSEDLCQMRPREIARQISYMHQDTQIPFDFSVLEVVLFGRHPYASPLQGHSSADKKKAMDCLIEVDCEHLADRPANTLSGGERQRIMLARALAQDTPILLLDEPTSSLDIRNSLDVFETCQKLAKKGHLVIAVLHDLRAAARYCTRVCLMNNGTIVADGEPEEVLHEGHIAYVYGVRVQTYRNPAGFWDFAIM